MPKCRQRLIATRGRPVRSTSPPALRVKEPVIVDGSIAPVRSLGGRHGRPVFPSDTADQAAADKSRLLARARNDKGSGRTVEKDFTGSRYMLHRPARFELNQTPADAHCFTAMAREIERVVFDCQRRHVCRIHPTC
jgi:hypothetical protein